MGIWPDGIEQFRCGLFHQGKDSIADYCSKAKKRNVNVKFCKDHFRNEFYRGLTLENKRYVEKNEYYRALVEMLI
jgi:hypothetical protein